MSIIVSRLTGGLGNQMFQFAAGYALSLRLGVPLELDVSSYAHDPLRVYELGVFDLRVKIASAATLARLPSKSKGIARLIKRVTPTPVGTIPIYREPHFEFEPRVRTLSAPHALSGYWQSERYFDDAREQVRAAFAALEPLEPENATLAAAITAEAVPVSLHIRRGDYVTSALANATHGTCSLEYYRAAMQSIQRQFPNARFFAFSDDTEWTRENLKGNSAITYVAANPPTRGYRDMQLMSLCHHHVIANSSFSWWGAWLNQKPDKRVVAPANWFASATKITRDLLPAGWERL